MILDANVVHTTKTHYTGKHTSKLTQMHHNKSTVMALDAETGTHNIAADRSKRSSIHVDHRCARGVTLLHPT